MPILRRLSCIPRWLAIRSSVATLMVFGGAACNGNPEIPSDPPKTVECTSTAIQPGPSPIRRLTRFEYNQTVRDLLGDTTEPANKFPPEEETSLGFNNIAANLTVSPALADKYLKVAEEVSGRATASFEQLAVAAGRAEKIAACRAPHVDGYRTCAEAFVDSFGPRAFRRPLTPEEREALLSVYDGAPNPRGVLGRDKHRLGLQMIIETTLQSPSFLYRVEFGTTDPDPALDAGVVRLSSYEMASRLSYFLWGSMPDDALFALAEQGALGTSDAIEAEARRMLADPRAHEAVAMFHDQWLDYGRLDNAGKDPALFPDWSPAISALMQEETRQFVDHVVFDEGGTLATLLTADYSYMNADLARFYGASTSGITESFERVPLDPEERAGLLTQGSLLARNAHTNQTSPVHRGKFVREQLLCGTLAPPPKNFDAPKVDQNATTRERFAQHSADPSCSGCHALMDAIGFGFENYDSIGRYRAEENGEPVDASGQLVLTDVDGKFVGAVALADRLADSDDVRSCYATQWFRYANGRGNTEEDVCTLEQVGDAFEASGGDIRELIVALTQTDAFLYRKADQGGDK